MHFATLHHFDDLEHEQCRRELVDRYAFDQSSKRVLQLEAVEAQFHANLVLLRGPLEHEIDALNVPFVAGRELGSGPFEKVGEESAGGDRKVISSMSKKNANAGIVAVLRSVEERSTLINV